MGRPVSLVIGACGFVGSHLVEVLAEADEKVRAVDLPEAWEREAPGPLETSGEAKGEDLELREADLRDPSTLATLLDSVSTVYLAADPAPGASLAEVRSVLVEGTKALVDLLLERSGQGQRIKLVVIGDGGVYGFPPPSELPITEETPPAPVGEVMRARWTREWIVLEAARTRGLSCSVLRPFGIYGPRGRRGLSHLLLTLARRKVVVTTRGLATRLPLAHVRDVARAAVHVGTPADSPGDVYNVVDESLMSLRDLSVAIARATGRPIVELPPLPRALRTPTAELAARLLSHLAKRARWAAQEVEPSVIEALGHDLVVSNRKLRRTGFELLYPDARQGLAETIAWYREQGWLDDEAST